MRHEQIIIGHHDVANWLCQLMAVSLGCGVWHLMARQAICLFLCHASHTMLS